MVLDQPRQFQTEWRVGGGGSEPHPEGLWVSKGISRQCHNGMGLAMTIKVLGALFHLSGPQLGPFSS